MGANIVLVSKKNGKILICIDYRDLNVAYPKDEFSLPIMDVMIDNTCDFERMSFMDSFSGYNQIRCTLMMKTHIFQDACGSMLLHSNALLLEECRYDISTYHERDLPRAYT